MFVDLVNDVGVNIALICFFVWQGKRFLETQTKENAELSKRLHDNEKEMRQTLVHMAKESSQALNNNTAVLRQLVRALESKPCMRKEDMPETSALERAES